uniref:Reverse transcriptase domain-containing protein n=1 Tax=Tanacetum cinerariifolium TaxID=118510 RepID=A0A699L161_TANCI|nr:reverse transcriptase domain-containing protein [Tanacetum cinerariifolium]
MTKRVLVEELKEKSTSEVEILAVVEEEGDTWMTSLFKYLTEGTLPADVKKARAIKRKSWPFAVVNETLYKKSFLGPWLRCVGPLQANYVLKEIDEGSCSMHAGTRSVVAKSLWTGYYWPTMHRDARTLIRACQDCQVHKPVLRNPQQKLTLVTSPWPFYKWGIDIAGPFSGRPGKIMENSSGMIRSKIGAKNYVSANTLLLLNTANQWLHGKSKSQLRRRDKIKVGCKKQEFDRRATSCSMGTPHNDKIKQQRHPVLINVRTEAFILAELGMLTLRTAEVDLVGNNEALEIKLDLLEERKEEASIREAKS